MRKLKLIGMVLALTLAVILFPSAVSAADDQIVTHTEINHPIAPIVGKKPVTAIDDTQWSATLTWTVGTNHTPVTGDQTFQAEADYQATIVVTPKTGYTLEGIADNGFHLDSAISFSRTDDNQPSATFVATFESLPATCVTDGHGLSAYCIETEIDIPEGQFLDFMFHRQGNPAPWTTTTYQRSGMEFFFRYNDKTPVFGNFIGETPATIDATDKITFHIVPELSADGRFVKVSYKVKNDGDKDAKISILGLADAEINRDDDANFVQLAEGRGFKVSERSGGHTGGHPYAINFFLRDTAGISGDGMFRFGSLDEIFGENEDEDIIANYQTNEVNPTTFQALLGQTERQNYNQTTPREDSGYAISFVDQTVPAGEEKIFSMLVGLGDPGKAPQNNPDTGDRLSTFIIITTLSIVALIGSATFIAKKARRR